MMDIFKDLNESLIEKYSDENVFIMQPCRDNLLYFFKTYILRSCSSANVVTRFW
ncbi:long chain base biosynthesis protein 2d [Iris pallida]|uniref:Long chain base biosynthesis protein 2d n=1 Tax=Iris pallida TaxID=29817 RepID=A0AAX6I0C4_IRIPA|nr:long chain base biosynthesis protein 2d [Iris pallida]